VPFDLTDADTSTDVILLSPWREYIDFRVETPAGDLLDPSAVAALVDSSFVPGSSLDAYRLSLPAIWPTHSAHAGRWHAHLSFGNTHANPGVVYDRELQSAGMARAAAHGAPYSVSVQARSSLTMTASATARRAAPATTVDHRVSLRQLDIPLDTRCTVVVEATDPSGATTTIALVGTGAGVFRLATDAPVAGIYTFRYLARGTSFAGTRFMREQVRTVGVWKGGDAPPPRSDPKHDEDCCTAVLACLLEDRGIQALLKRYDIDARRLSRCLSHSKGKP
jgi:hypothetical protein